MKMNKLICFFKKRNSNELNGVDCYSYLIFNLFK